MPCCCPAIWPRRPMRPAMPEPPCPPFSMPSSAFCICIAARLREDMASHSFRAAFLSLRYFSHFLRVLLRVFDNLFLMIIAHLLLNVFHFLQIPFEVFLRLLLPLLCFRHVPALHLPRRGFHLLRCLLLLHLL